MSRLVFLLLLISFISVNAQNTFSGWINHNQTYVKFKIAEDGVYRIDRNTLKDINNQFLSVNPKNLQVFARGKEQAIYVHGENDFSFDVGDYIELYCRKNDGFLDSLMYEDPSQFNNPYNSHINDTISYFLTWENSPSQKKRISTYSSANHASFSALTTIEEEQIVSYNNEYYRGSSTANYSSGKGWFDAAEFVYGQVRLKSFDISNRLSSSNINVTFSVCGVPNTSVFSNLNHQVKVHHNDIEKYEVNYSGYGGALGNFELSSTVLSSNNLGLNFSSNYNSGGQVDRNTLAYVKLNYKRQLDFDGTNFAEFFVETSAESQTLTFTNFAGTNIYLYNLSANERTAVVPVSGQIKALINNNPKAKIALRSEESLKTVLDLENITFTDYSNLSTDPDYLIVYHQKLSSSAEEYASYRSLQGHKVLKVEINDLYNQFAYGIEKHPLSIRHFVDFLSNTYATPRFLFLLGKSISPEFNRNSGSAYSNTLVPTMGAPPSDVLLTSNLDGLGLYPTVSTGRLAARNNADVLTYLQKVKDYESASDGLWKKRAVHFGGGSSESQQFNFMNYLKQYESIFEDTLVGGQVSTFLKNSSDPIQISVYDSVEYLINEGVSLMTFFGHGSSSGFDQNIDGPENYNNLAKYPLIVANSCLSGDIHQNSTIRTISEEWVLIQNKGSIGFLAASDVGYAPQLYLLSKAFYTGLSSTKYGSSIGEITQEAIKQYSDGQLSNSMVRKTCFDNTLHCDPAIVMNSFEKPDLQISNSGISFNPEPVTTNLDSFELNIEYFNVGRAFSDTFLISVEREYPNSESEFQIFVETSCMYSDVLSIKLPTDLLRGIGVNKLKIRLDYLNQIDELIESNNNIEVEFYIHSNDLVPIYPYEYSVVPNSTISLYASSGDPFAPPYSVVFQIDTNDTFNSPVFLSNTMSSDGGISEWALPFSLVDSSVYFWRVSIVGTDRWKESSFRYIDGQTGWSQAHHFQYEKDNFQFIDYKKNERKFEFVNSHKTLLCTNIGSNLLLPRIEELGFWIDGVGDNNSCGAGSSFFVVVIDSLSMEPWTTDRGDFGQVANPICTGSRIRPDKYFQFSRSGATAMEDMADFINQIPFGFHVLIYTSWNGAFTSLPENAKLAIENLYPSSNIRNIEDNKPYILYARKGFLDNAEETVGAGPDSEIELSKNLITNFDFGSISSTIIGPAKQWGSFHWNYRDNIDAKNTKMSISAIDNQGDNQVLINGLTKDSLNVLDLSSRIDANQYPFLNLQMYCKDSIQKKPTQLKSWTLLYEEAPETAIEPSEAYYFYNDTIEQGEDLAFVISTKNISLVDMDSLKVSYFVKDAQNNITRIKSEHLQAHPSLDVITDTVYFNTKTSSGRNSIWAEFNSVDSLTGQYDQLEQHHFNNIAIKYFYVKTDKINPLLNVTFDGIHIMDGDIVSPNPEILFRINDENKYLTMDDPDLVSVYLKTPYHEDEIKIELIDSLNNQQLFWTASRLPENIAEMLFLPKDLADGKYMLRVGATDASSNESGKYDYQRSFEVINKSTITEILNYPNPFSTSTQFVFTLTGSEIPEEIVLQIMTVTGKVVKEVNLSTESNLNIGRNITDYKWDGRDEYGDLLANGVYFYRVFVKMNGTEVEKSQTQADKYFKEGIGKMYIIR